MYMFLVLLVPFAFRDVLARTQPQPTLNLTLPEPESCPTDESLPDLDFKRMLGFWYVTHTTDTIPASLRNPNIKPVECQAFQLTQKSNNQFQLTHLFLYDQNWKSYSKEFIIVPDKTNPSNSSDPRETNFVVFSTDYDNYAAVITCEQHFSYFRLAKILSRIPTVNLGFVEQVVAKLASYNFDASSLQPVIQEDCVKIDVESGGSKN